MRFRPIRWAALAAAVLLVAASDGVGAKRRAVTRPIRLSGRVSYRTGPRWAVKPEAYAKVWVYRGRQALAVRSVAKLQAFEKAFPEGLTRVEDRPKEYETRKVAMVLFSYAAVHKRSLRSFVPVKGDGSFQFTWDGKEPVTVVVESGDTVGSYHMPRFAVVVLEPRRPVPSLQFDFGVSHLEEHPTSPAASGQPRAR